MKHNLTTLSILHYVYGALVCLGGGVVFLLFGVGAIVADQAVAHGAEEVPPDWIGGFIASFGLGLFLILLIWGILIVLSGYWIAKRRNRTFSIVVAALCLLSFPIGTALGIFTLVVLVNDEVRKEYEVSRALPGVSGSGVL